MRVRKQVKGWAMLLVAGTVWITMSVLCLTMINYSYKKMVKANESYLDLEKLKNEFEQLTHKQPQNICEARQQYLTIKEFQQKISEISKTTLPELEITTDQINTLAAEKAQLFYGFLKEIILKVTDTTKPLSDQPSCFHKKSLKPYDIILGIKVLDTADNNLGISKIVEEKIYTIAEKTAKDEAPSIVTAWRQNYFDKDYETGKLIEWVYVFKIKPQILGMDHKEEIILFNLYIQKYAD